MTSPAVRVRDWQQLAACRDADPELFFPEAAPGTDAGAAQVNAARAVCRQCPVAVDCLRFALQTRQAHGIWGGSTAAERHAERRRILRSLRRTAA